MRIDMMNMKSESFRLERRLGPKANSTGGSYEERIRLLRFGEKSLREALKKANHVTGQRRRGNVLQATRFGNGYPLPKSDQPLPDRVRSFRQKTRPQVGLLKTQAEPIGGVHALDVARTLRVGQPNVRPSPDGSSASQLATVPPGAGQRAIIFANLANLQKKEALK